MLPIDQYFFLIPLKELADKGDSSIPMFCGKNCTINRGKQNNTATRKSIILCINFR